MKKIIYYSFLVVGTATPFLAFAFCQLIKLDSSIIVALISSSSTIVCGVVNLIIEKIKKSKNSQSNSINNGIFIDKNNKIIGNLTNTTINKD